MEPLIYIHHHMPLFFLTACHSFFYEELVGRLSPYNNKDTTLSGGYLGSRNDEERSQLR